MPDIQSHPVFLSPRRLQPELPLFVFLPGMDGTGQLLQLQTAGLEAAFDVRCLAIPPDDLSGWRALAAQVVDLVRAELKTSSATRPVYLCGESFGGCLAMQVALHEPELFDRLILVNPASSFQSRPWIAWGSQISRWLPESVYRLLSIGLMPLLANLERMAATDRAAIWKTVQSVPQTTSIWRLSLLSQFDVTTLPLHQLTQPVLLIASVHDRLLPSLAEVHRLAQRFPSAKVVTLPRSGHACLLECDVNLYEILETQEFLSPAVQAAQAE
jgi:pimeloyl-ACP methyl ester carboxylesterase